MKDNQKGFTAIEGLLIALIVGLVGFVGWYVYSSQNKTNDILDSTSTGSVQPKKKITAKQTQTADSTANWKTYTSSKSYTGAYYGFKYNPNWTYSECEAHPGAPNSLLLSDSKSTVGHCASDAPYRIFIYALFDGPGACGPGVSNSTNINKDSSKVSILSGQIADRDTWTTSSGGEGPTDPVGTKNICYEVQGSPFAMELIYKQYPSGTGSTDLSADFDLMVAKTLQLHQ